MMPQVHHFADLYVIQAVSPGSLEPDRYYDLTKADWKQRSEVQKELAEQGFFVRHIAVEDTMMIQVAAKLRAEQEAEAEK